MNNDRKAQEELYRRFSPVLFGICLRYSSHIDDANDILQESFIRIFSRLKTYKNEGILGAWIRKITVNCALEFYRKKQTRKRHEESSEEYIDSTDINETLSQLDLKDLMKKIQLLPTGYRMVFNLYAIEGYNHREISELLDISEGTSKSQFSRAKQLLKKMLSEEINYEQIQLKHAR